MEVEEFTKTVFNTIERLKEELEENPKHFSDIIDDDGFQYVDIVMEGGGVLGIALVGFTYVLEEMGIRFLQIGGTSAGAINALLIAGMGTPAEAKSEKILQKLADVDMKDFIDGDTDSRDFIETWLRYGNESFASPKGKVHGFIDRWIKKAGKAIVYGKVLQVWDNIREDLGLNPGREFQNWIRNILFDEGIKTTEDLLNRLNHLPKGLRHRDPKKPLDVKPDLALIAADVSTQTKAIFPKMAELYWENPGKVNPSDYVRASMSVPFFFHPFRVDNIPQDEDSMRRWRKIANYEDILPETCTFIDGGIMSNFPINLFHRPDRVPPAPTFGVKLGLDKPKTDSITQPFKLVSVIFDSARLNLDNDFIARNPDYRKLVTCIDTVHHNWLNFSMDDKEKIELFEKGALAAVRFIKEFDWEEYKRIRKGIAQAVNSANMMQDVAGDAVKPTL